MTRNVAQNTRPSFRFLGEGSGDETILGDLLTDKGVLEQTHKAVAWMVLIYMMNDHHLLDFSSMQPHWVILYMSSMYWRYGLSPFFYDLNLARTRPHLSILCKAK